MFASSSQGKTHFVATLKMSAPCLFCDKKNGRNEHC